jgi:hypothetical protein
MLGGSYGKLQDTIIIIIRRLTNMINMPLQLNASGDLIIYIWQLL